MTSACADGQATATCNQYRALLAVSEAIVAHHDLPALFHDLADRLHPVVRFDYLALLLHDAAIDGMRLHILESSHPLPVPPDPGTPLNPDPALLVWQTQQPLIISQVEDLQRWPEFPERVQRYGVQSFCFLPLTTSRRRWGTMVFADKQPRAYDTADLGFLQLLASQVAVAVENALAFQEIETLKNQLAQEKAYLQEEVRTEHNFWDNASARRLISRAAWPGRTAGGE